MNYQNIAEAIAQGPEVAGQIIDGACSLRGYQRPANAVGMSPMSVPQAPNGMPNGGMPNGGMPNGGGCPLPQQSSQANGSPSGSYCGVYSGAIQQRFASKCQAQCDPCWLQLLDQSVARQSWAMVRNQIGRSFMRFGLSGYTATNQPTPDPDNAATTNFVAGPTIAPGESVLVRQDKKFTLPWRPGCLKLTLGFSAGTIEGNMTHVQAKVFVMQRGSFLTSGPLAAFAVEWNPDEFYSGDQFRCGDNCAEVQIIGSLGCAIPIEHVGDENEMIIQIFNDATASASINAVNTIVSFAGLKKACCDSCNSGGGCSCGK